MTIGFVLFTLFVVISSSASSSHFGKDRRPAGVPHEIEFRMVSGNQEAQRRAAERHNIPLRYYNWARKNLKYSEVGELADQKVSFAALQATRKNVDHGCFTPFIFRADRVLVNTRSDCLRLIKGGWSRSRTYKIFLLKRRSESSNASARTRRRPIAFAERAQKVQAHQRRVSLRRGLCTVLKHLCVKAVSQREFPFSHFVAYVNNEMILAVANVFKLLTASRRCLV